MKGNKLLLFCLWIVFSPVALNGQSYLKPSDDLFWKIVPEGAEIEKLSTGFMFTEGPVWSPEGFLLFTDIPANKIYRLDQDGSLTTYMEPTGNANGLMYDADGDLFLCQHSERQIAKDNGNGGYTPVCGEYAGQRFNSPNDLDISREGIIYFTDPPYGLSQGMNDPAKELSYQGVFMYREGKVHLLDSTLSTPNGIILSPDEKYLYVADSRRSTGEKRWYRYRINKDGTVKDRKVFADASDSEEPGGPDGMTVDLAGNVYVTGPGGIRIYDPKGTLLGVITFPEVPANCCLGGPDGRELYVTARTSVYRIRLKDKD